MHISYKRKQHTRTHTPPPPTTKIQLMKYNPFIFSYYIKNEQQQQQKKESNVDDESRFRRWGGDEMK
jgi:hypothetical protein